MSIYPVSLPFPCSKKKLFIARLPSSRCASRGSVQDWYADPSHPERQFGWVSETTEAYVRPVKRIAVRCRKPDGTFAYGVLISALSAQHVLTLTGQSLSLLDDPTAVLLAYLRFYDQRGGGVE